jgi:uncharacterized membrane protein
MGLARTVHTVPYPSLKTGLVLTANIGILAIIYTFLGAIVSFVFYYLFDEYNPYEKKTDWEKRSLHFKILDIVLEILLISIGSFWIGFTLNNHFPIIPIASQYAGFVDTYSAGLFFMLTIFIFVDSFGYKIHHVFNKYVAPLFDYIFPQYGSIVNLSLSYRKNKSNSNEST